MNMENPLDNLSESERSEMARFSKALTAYVVSLDAQRVIKIVDPVNGQKRSKLDDEIDHGLRPSDQMFFRDNELWWKAFKPQASSTSSS